MSLTRWLGLGFVSAAAIAAIVIGLVGSGSQGDESPVVVSASVTQHEGGSRFSLPSLTTDANPALETSSSSVEATTADGSMDAPGTSIESVPPAQHPTTNAEVRLRIPALGVDAPVTSLGFDGAGGFAVPTTATAVGWYEFSAAPGAAGNAVLGGHLNWAGSRGVFDRLDELSPGDMIYVDVGNGELAFRVSGSHSVTAQTPFVDILGERSGPSTLTLFTCGGTYSSAAGEYDQRLVVSAVRA